MTPDRQTPLANAALETIADVGAQGIARVYAEALYRAAEGKGEVDGILAELNQLVGGVCQANPEFEAFFSSGVLGRERKAAVIESTFSGRASETILHFLLVLNDHERLDLLRPIVAAYGLIRDERARRIQVRVRSAVPLQPDQRRRLEEEIRQALNREPILETTVDGELLGGMIVRVGDWLFDGSVRTKLMSLRDQIIARSSHEIQSGRDRFSTPIGN